MFATDLLNTLLYLEKCRHQFGEAHLPNNTRKFVNIVATVAETNRQATFATVSPNLRVLFGRNAGRFGKTGEKFMKTQKHNDGRCPHDGAEPTIRKVVQIMTPWGAEDGSSLLIGRHPDRTLWCARLLEVRLRENGEEWRIFEEIRDSHEALAILLDENQ